MGNSKENEAIGVKKRETIKQTDEEWKKQLDPEAYYVLRHKGTERPFVNNKYYAQGKG